MSFGQLAQGGVILNIAGFYSALSRDHGKSWSRTDFKIGAFLNIEVISHDNVWLIGPETAFQTIDQGQTWVNHSASLKGGGVAFRKIAFTTTKVGYLLGNRTDDWGGKLYATEDGGRTWTIRKVWGYEMQANGMAIVGNTIYVAGDDLNESGPNDVASVIASTDGGYNWREVMRSTDSSSDAGIFQIGDILYTASSEYFWHFEPNHAPKTDGATANGSIPIGQQYEYFVKATDPDGDSLSYRFLKAPGFLYIDEKTGRIWGTPAVGDVGNHLIVVEVSDPYGATATLTVVWTFGDEQSTAVADELVAGVPAKFALAQNYPNPFNPETTIKYSLPKEANVRLSVFDLAGQELIILVDERQQSGDYLVRFTVENLPSGPYIVRLIAGGSAQTRKMLLLK